MESVFSLLKRGIMGTFHSVSKKHCELPEHSRVDDGERVSRAIVKSKASGCCIANRWTIRTYLVDAPSGQADAPF